MQQLETRLKAAESRVATLCDCSPWINAIGGVLAVVTNASGVVVSYNPVTTELLGYARSEMLDMQLVEAITPHEYQNEMHAALTKAALGRQGSALQCAWYQRSGQQLHLTVNANLLSQDGRDAVLWIGRPSNM